MTIDADIRGQWDSLASQSHEAQAVWFLNAFWNGGIKEKAEDIWKWFEAFKAVDPNGGTGCDHDEFWSHKFLEDNGETVTVLELRKKLAEIDIDKNKRMCFSEYLLWKFNKGVKALVTAPQGESDELEKAKQLVEEATKAFDDCIKALEDAKKAKAAAAAALKQLNAEEEAYNKKCAELEAQASGGGVKGLRAKNELDQLKAEDPLPLRRAKITNESAVRRATATQKWAEESMVTLEQKKKEALEYLERVQAAGCGAGQVWWMKRGMYEKQKFLPTAKQTMAYPKPE